MDAEVQVVEAEQKELQSEEEQVAAAEEEEEHWLWWPLFVFGNVSVRLSE